mmetsp:Transcript_10958/g.33864  ORF Transcript_10958/g.33864 Transcript_10958/m.33864 type:complete len:215 (-) Transcript_10958:34-678(-)
MQTPTGRRGRSAPASADGAEAEAPAQEELANLSAVLAQAGGMRALTDEEANAYTKAHNQKRCMHGAPAVTWSAAMASNAKAYIGPKTQLVHSDSYHLKPPAGPAGENLFWSSGKATASAAVNAWYNEVNSCKGGPAGFTDGCYAGVNGKGTGHFTAMVWSTVKQIGCAVSNNGHIVICRYKSGNKLDLNTPNMQRQANYAKHVKHRVKTQAQCR